MTPAILAGMDRSPFSPDDLAAMSDEARGLVETQAEYLRQHPITAIWRQATTGSLTRDGGVVSSASADGNVMTSNGEPAGFAVIGDEVTYPDGSTARIVSGSGSRFSNNGTGYALVGSLLNNGDEIISTPQKYAVLCCRDGESMPEDFLKPVSLAEA